MCCLREEQIREAARFNREGPLVLVHRRRSLAGSLTLPTIILRLGGGGRAAVIASRSPFLPCSSAAVASSAAIA